jgi:signal transduction histidine kinase
MLLRQRLTLLNTLLVGGLLLIFGAAAYQLVTLALTYQVDRELAITAGEALDILTLDENGAVSTTGLENMVREESFYFQLWSRNKQIIYGSPTLSSVQPLDMGGFGLTAPVFKDQELRAGDPVRVLTIPLQVGRKPVGTMMIGTDLSLISILQNSMISVILWGVLSAVGLVGFGVWFSSNRALSPLEQVSETALQITHAEDLAKRIPYSGPDDEVGRLISAFNETLERLEKLFKTQRQFISDVSHELRTPLTVIKGNLDLLRQMKCIEDEEFDAINDEVNRLTRMVQDLLLIAQAESGRLPLEKEEVSLDTLLLEVMQQAKILADNRVNLKLKDIDQVIVFGDNDRLRQVLLNILSNAVKFTPDGGEINISLRKTVKKSVLSITDSGPGIPEEDIPHIFKRFYRAEKARTRSSDSGFGLGLSIAYWIVRNHEGDILVRTKEGKGTTFTILLPLLDSVDLS